MTGKCNPNIKTAFLKNKNRSGVNELASGKITGKKSANNFLFYLIELENPPQESKVLRKIVQIFENNSKTIVGDITPEMFEKSLTMINQTLDRLAKNGDGDWMGNINAVIGIIQHDDLFLSQTGKIVGYIARKNKISSLSENNTELAKPIHTFSEITSGKVTAEDQVFFATKSLLDHVPFGQIREFLKFKDSIIVAKNICNILRRSKNSNVNALFFSLDYESYNPDEIMQEVFYIDEPETTVFSEFFKKAKPLLADIAKKIGIFAKKATNKTLEYTRSTKDNFENKVAPKTKDLLKSNFEKLKEKEELKKFKIKTNPYKKNNHTSNNNEFLKNILFLLSKTKFIFSKENRKYLYGGLIIIVLFFGYAKIKHNNDKRNDKAEQIEILNAYDKAYNAFNKAKEDLLLNKTTDLTPLYAALSLAEKAKENPNNRDKSEALIKNIYDILDERTKSVRFYDSANFSLGDSVKNIVLAGTEIFGIDQSGKIYLVDTRDKEEKLVGSISKDAGDVKSINFSSSQNRILISTSKKIIAFNPDSQTLEEINLVEGQWSTSTAISTYSSNIYVLDASEGEIFKHTKKDGGYSKGTSYTNTTRVSIKNAIDFAIDGNFFVLKGDGTVAKFVRGSYDQDFTIKNIPAPYNSIGEGAKIVTSEDMASIFILDKKFNRILKFDKSGEFLNQYYFEGILVENFVVNSKLQKIWALSEGKIYEGNL